MIVTFTAEITLQMPETYPTHLWEPVRIPADKSLVFSLGHLSVTIQVGESELHLHTSRDEATPYETGVALEPRQLTPSGNVEDFACQIDAPVIQVEDPGAPKIE